MPPAPATVVAALRESLHAPPGKRVYGVVDAASCVDLAYEANVMFGKEIRSLFLPEVQTPLWDVAPYLIPIDLAGDYVDNWARRWGTNAGVLLVSEADEQALYEHLRKIFVVVDEEKQEYFFRFYDPRVLLTFLPTCTTAQLEEFFGPIEELVGEADQGRALLRFSRADGELVTQRVDLEPASARDRRPPTLTHVADPARQP